MTAKIAQPWRVSLTITPKVSVSAALIARIAHSSIRLEMAFGFSNGCAELTSEEAAAIGAQLLDGNLRGRRPLRGTLLLRLQALSHRYRVAKFCGNALPDQHKCHDNRHRKQHVKHAARQIDPEISDRVCIPPREAANERNRQRNPGGGRNEIIPFSPGICVK